MAGPVIAPSTPRRRPYLFVFLLATVVAAYVYRQWADWWAYVQDPIRGPWPKFVLPWWWQLGVSLVVGSAAGGLVLALALCVVKLWRRTNPGIPDDQNPGCS